MADSRIIPKFIYTSRTFLNLSVSAKNLMTYLILYTDNDGIVEAYSVMEMIKAVEGDLKALSDAGFIYILNKDWVTYIMDFQKFNKGLDKRYFKTSQHRDLLVQVLPQVETELVKPKKKKSISSGYPADVHGISSGCPPDIHTRTEQNLTEQNLTEQNKILCINNNYSNQSSPSCPSNLSLSDRQENIKALLEIIEENVSYDDLIVSYPNDIELLHGFIQVILDAVLTESETVRICGEDKPRELVKSQLMKLTYTDIVHVLEQFKSQQVEIKKKRQYVLSMLYQTKMELKAHYVNLVEADQHRGRE